ncbi:MAG: hypothetical protein R2830_05545 [Saprospiraceae bacterium]
MFFTSEVLLSGTLRKMPNGERPEHFFRIGVVCKHDKFNAGAGFGVVFHDGYSDGHLISDFGFQSVTLKYGLQICFKA